MRAPGASPPFGAADVSTHKKRIQIQQWGVDDHGTMMTHVTTDDGGPPLMEDGEAMPPMLFHASGVEARLPG